MTKKLSELKSGMDLDLISHNCFNNDSCATVEAVGSDWAVARSGNTIYLLRDYHEPFKLYEEGEEDESLE